MLATPKHPEFLPYGKIREDLFHPLSGLSRRYFTAIPIQSGEPGTNRNVMYPERGR
jgi:hypothetical protein